MSFCASRNIFLAVWLGFATSLAATEFLNTTWRTEDGLPHSAVNSIVQTHDGYLWIGTYVGLVRFDGVRFVHFSTAKMPQLGPGRVSKLFEDRSGVLWVGLESGRLLAVKDGEARIHLPNSPSAKDAANSIGGDVVRRDDRRDRPTPNDAVISMVQDAAGTIWVQTANGHFGRITSDSVEFLANTGPLFMRASLGLVLEENGTLWVGTKDGLRIWEKGALTEVPGLGGLAKLPVDCFGPARHGGIWLYRDRIVYKVVDRKSVEEIPVPRQFEGNAVELIEATDGKLWLGAGNGGVYCRESGVWRDISVETGLRGSSKVLVEDREGNIWRGSFGGGLTRFRPKLFTTYELPDADFDRYAGGVTTDTNGGAWMLVNGHTLGHIPKGASGTNALELWRQPAVPQGLRTIFADRRGTLWLGWGDGRIGRWLNGSYSVDLKAGDESDFLNAFFEDAHGNVWVGFSQGAGVGVMTNGDWNQWHVFADMPYPDVRAIAQAPDGSMWFGTHYGGAFRYQNGTWTRFTTRDGLVSDYVRCLYTDPDGTIWLGTMYGLSRWRDGKFTSIKTENGLWHGSLSSMVEDDRGNFWMSSFGGIFRVSRQELNDFCDGRRASIQSVNYDRNDGLQALESPGGFQPAGVKSADGRLWFPTVDGVVCVDPNHLTENKLAPPVVIEEVIVDGVSQAVPAGGIEIPPGKKRIEIRFTGLSFTAPEKVRFRHRLEGLESEWFGPDERRSVTYNLVPPGRYTLHVTACNNDGVWSKEGVALKVIVQPHFWQTWWFKTGIGLGVVAGLVWFVKQREEKKARTRLEQLERIHAVERERARIAQDIHDDVGATLTQIAFLSERVKLAGGDLAEVGKWNQRVSNAARETIQSLDEIVWAVSPENDTLESLANYLARFAQDHLSLAGVRCILDMLTVLPPVAVTAELRHNLLLAAREALQNAVTHAKATEVHVGLELREDALEIRITDNGAGFDPKLPGAGGHGLTNMQKRLAEIGGKTEIVSEPGRGTTIKFSVPRARLETLAANQPAK